MKLALILACLLSLSLPTAAQDSNFKGWVFYEEGDLSPTYRVIKSQKQLDSFLEILPKKAPHKRQPAPKNPDPLLLTNAVDFTKNILVIAMRKGTISTHPIYLAKDTQEDKVVLWFEIPDPPPEARPYGWGVYRGVLIPRTDKPIKVKFD